MVGPVEQGQCFGVLSVSGLIMIIILLKKKKKKKRKKMQLPQLFNR